MEETSAHPHGIPKNATADNARVFQSLVSTISDYAIFAMDPRGLILTWNAGAKRLKGYSAEEVIGTSFERFYSEADIARGHPRWELEQAAANGTYEEEGYRIRKDGSRFWASVVITALRDEHGKLSGFGKVTRDLTARRQAEEALRQSEERLAKSYKELERRVEERTAELQEAKERAEKAVASRDEFFSIASHELRTPITSLKLKAQIAKRSLKAKKMESPEQIGTFVSDIESQVDRLVRLIEDMLDLARVSTGRLPMEFKPQDVSDAAKDAVARLEPLFVERSTPIRFQGCADAIANIDRDRFQQVVTNVLTNALRYAPGKPVSVEVRKHDGKISVSVRDQGPGIARESQKQIFNRYERLQPSANVAGLGIGLYLSRSIMHEHKGTLTVESEPGHGAVFTIELPAAAESGG